MRLFLSSSCFWFLPVLCLERENPSSFLNRAAGVKKVVHSGLRRIVSARWWHAIGEMLVLCSAAVRFFVPACRPTYFLLVTGLVARIGDLAARGGGYRRMGPFLTPDRHRAIQTEPRSPPSHPEAAAQGDELGRL